jgi:hypothetical protein
VRLFIGRILSSSLLAISCLAFAGPAAAVSFGPLAVVAPSAIVPQAGPGEALTGSITLDVTSVPVVAPTLFRLTDVSVLASGGASFALDPAIASPALGVVQASGAFQIPTLFLRVTDGATSFDLAVPNVGGTLLFGAGGDVVGLMSTFQVDSITGGILTVNLVAAVPEPGTALLIAFGLGALALKKGTIR